MGRFNQSRPMDKCALGVRIKRWRGVVIDALGIRDHADGRAGSAVAFAKYLDFHALTLSQRGSEEPSASKVKMR